MNTSTRLMAKAFTLAASLSFLAALALSAAKLPEAYKPADDEVIEVLPQISSGRRQIVERILRQQYEANPKNREVALQYARALIMEGQALGSPREFGRAEAVLAPWWQAPDAPTELLVLKATIVQFFHRFDEAHSIYMSVIDREPTNAQAILNDASILLTAGRYDESLARCRLLKSAAAEVAGVCTSIVQSYTGDLEKGCSSLNDIMAQGAGRLSPETLRWGFTSLADCNERLGRMQAAEQFYLAALRLRPDDGVLLGLFADFLIAQGQQARARDLLKEQLGNEALLLRSIIARQILAKDKDVQSDIQRLEKSYQQAHERGTALHQREEAMYYLKVKRDSRRALELAAANWQVQREPIDTRLYLETAVLAGNEEAKQEIRDWLKRTKMQDHYLDALMSRK